VTQAVNTCTELNNASDHLALYTVTVLFKGRVILRQYIPEEGARVAQSVQCLAMDWTTGQSGFNPQYRQRIFALASV
jgi:hypothetical protein